MIIPPNKKGEMLIDEIQKEDKANLNLVRDLIVLGANVDWQNNNGCTALHWCAYNNHSRILGLLIDAGADVNIQQDNGWTALHYCAWKNHPRIARMLLDAGANLNIQGNNGKVPYELAESKELIELLKV